MKIYESVRMWVAVMVSILAAVGGVQAGLVTNITQETSYTSIQDAVNNANDNDIIEVYAGTYDEQVLIQGGGIATGVTVRAAAGQTPVMTPTADDSYAFKIEREGTTIQGFEITGEKVKAGVRLYSSARILDNTFHDMATDRSVSCISIDYGPDPGIVIAGNSIYNIGDGDDTYCSAIATGTQGSPWEAMVVSNNTIRNVRIVSTGSSIIKVYGNNTKIVDNNISDVSCPQYNGVIYVYGSNILIQNNRIWDPRGIWAPGIAP